MPQSSIEWTEMTWNPTTGCDKISAGCKNCYAEIMAKRLKAMGDKKYQNGFQLTLHESELEKPYLWKKPRMIFVNSMSDLFHKDIPIEFIQKVFKVMNECTWHTFQVLTKRAELLLQYDQQGYLQWTNNIWMGVSIENNTVYHRIDCLRQTNAKIKFLSCEPLLGSLSDMDLTNIDWVIVGGESGPNARPIQEKWVLEIKEQCEKLNIPFFFKQWGGVNKKKNGRLLQGKTYDQMPQLLRP
ncbi:MAG: phage Gp37/Gp68 family protein [Bacteroidia bacterium]|nr:phage Gp37/Gp68 family protein [Bacteroidia bacterium]MDW8348305.1 phage Gp37/Gp68 family protein [Bacteroidia bacterium]